LFQRSGKAVTPSIRGKGFFVNFSIITRKLLTDKGIDAIAGKGAAAPAGNFLLAADWAAG
jgi:hypothetical protein